MSIAFGIFTATALVIFTNDIEDGRLHRGGSPKGVEGEDALRSLSSPNISLSRPTLQPVGVLSLLTISLARQVGDGRGEKMGAERERN
eukprot:1326405-Amorphochlora_amoeboformis.AAC.2